MVVVVVYERWTYVQPTFKSKKVTCQKFYTKRKEINVEMLGINSPPTPIMQATNEHVLPTLVTSNGSHLLN